MLKNALAFAAVRDIEDGIRWYKMVLGREPDTQPRTGLAEWQFEAGGWVNENKQLAGRSSITLVETGNDVVAVRAAAETAIAAARDGQGPRFIEAVTYRLGDHTTSDDAARYRPAEDVQAHWKEEPIARLRNYLAGQKMWSKAEEEQLAAECHERIEAAVERYLTTEPRRPETMFDHLYAELPEAYAGQRRELAGENDV